MSSTRSEAQGAERSISKRRLTPALLAVLLAERALEQCRCGSPERAAALAALSRVLEGELTGESRKDEHLTGDHDGD